MSGPGPSIPSAPPPATQARPSRAHGHYGLLPALQALFELLVLAIFIAGFLVQPSRISSESMQPTLQVGDFLLIDKQSYFSAGVLDKLLPSTTVHRGDLVVFHYPVDPGRHLVKRVVGLPGDRLKMTDGSVEINDTDLNEPYAFYAKARPEMFRDNFPSSQGVILSTDPNIDPAWLRWLETHETNGEVVVPPGNYFVMGDNRNYSEDSRYWGFVPRADLVGRPLLVYFALPPESDHAEPLRLPFAAALRLRLTKAWSHVRVLR